MNLSQFFDFWRVSILPRRKTLLSLQCFGITLLLVGLGSTLYRGKKVFWDLEVYRTAAAALERGDDPYTSTGELYFVYPPLVAKAFNFLGESSLPLAAAIAYATSFVLFALAARRLLFWAMVISAAVYVRPQSFGVSVMTGNVTLYLHFALVVALLAIRRRGIMPFNLTLIVASLIKPYFLAYGLALFILDGVSRRTAAIFASCLVGVFLIYVAQYLLLPEMFHGFVSALSNQAIGTESLGPGRDVGQAAYYYFAHVLERGPALAAHFAAVGLLVTLILFLSFPSARKMTTEDGFLFLVLISTICAVLLNPRLKIYDWAMLQAAATAAFLMIRVYLRRSVWPLLGMLGAIVASQVFVFEFLVEPRLWLVHVATSLPIYGSIVLLCLELHSFNRKQAI